MAAKWILKLTPEESKFIEGVAIEYVDKVLSFTERDNCVNLLNHIGHSKWGVSKFKLAMSACRKQLGIKGKKGFEKGTKLARKPKETPVPTTITEPLQEWERKLLNHINQIIKNHTKSIEEENTRLRKERDEARLELRSLVKIKQAVEEIQDNHRKRG